MEMVFKIDDKIKQEFLDSKPDKTAESVSFVLRAVDDYEISINKLIYNMTYSELCEMLKRQFKNSSAKTVLKNISILRKYINFCINKHIVLHGENRLSTFTSKEAKELVNKQVF